MLNRSIKNLAIAAPVGLISAMIATWSIVSFATWDFGGMENINNEAQGLVAGVLMILTLALTAGIYESLD